VIEKSTSGGPRAFNNVRGTLGALFSFAQRRGYLPRDRNHEVSLVDPREDRSGGQIVVYTPEEFRMLLAHADKRLLPFLALGGLAGLRSSEICRVTWEMIDLDRGHILLGKEFTKTRRRRVVPVCPALASWLRPLRGSGRIYEFEDSSSLNRMSVRHWPRDNQKKALVERRPNALRHSYGTYRFAVLQDEQKVSAEMGNSPQELREHYAELATPDQAKAWFGISRPGTAAPRLRVLKGARGAKPAAPGKSRMAS
jgi:integrase